jgi:hypothetical protein
MCCQPCGKANPTFINHSTKLAAKNPGQGGGGLISRYTEQRKLAPAVSSLSVSSVEFSREYPIIRLRIIQSAMDHELIDTIPSIAELS